MSENKILIADDNQANAELLEAYLAEVDCELEFAYDGEETIAKVGSFQTGPGSAGRDDAQTKWF